MRKSEGSLAYESNEIFHKAKDEAETLTPPKNFCPKGCVVPSRARVVFRITPNKFLTDYGDSEHCNELQQASAAQPYHYETISLHSIDDLNKWIGDLSQGNGENGKDLYKKCDASCSPKYEYQIKRTKDTPREYLVSASITCGAARDKDDNQYKLDAVFRWRCEKSKE